MAVFRWFATVSGRVSAAGIGTGRIHGAPRSPTLANENQLGFRLPSMRIRPV
jgi:hypothetical protein